MAERKTHKDVEFSVLDYGGEEKMFRRFDDAAGFAVALAASDGRWHNLNVYIHSVSGARWWGGDYAVEEYESDPDASVSERIKIKANSEGRVY